MNTKHYTSIEQSKKLLELGLNPESADMFYSRRPTGKSDYGIFPDFKPESRLEVFTKADLPCWSLGALLEVMPKETEWLFEDSNAFIGYGDGCYRCVYLNGNWESSHQEVGNSYIEAAFNMVVWLLENGYIKKEPKIFSE